MFYISLNAENAGNFSWMVLCQGIVNICKISAKFNNFLSSSGMFLLYNYSALL